MRIVGLTGGIASGKTTLSNLFKSAGVPVVDADVVARDVVKKGTGGWKKVVASFGNDILLENGEIDRARLGQIVFSDPSRRQLLNRLLAPYISCGILWEVVKLWFKGSKVMILDIPLLFEVKMDRWTKPIIVVWVDPETQLQRLMARDGSSEEEARNRIDAQISLESKRAKADIVIDNSGSVEQTREQFDKVLRQVNQPLTWKEYSLSREGFCTTDNITQFLMLSQFSSSTSSGNSALDYQQVGFYVDATFYTTSYKYGIMAYGSDLSFLEAFSGSMSVYSASEVKYFATLKALYFISQRPFTAAVIYSDSQYIIFTQL